MSVPVDSSALIYSHFENISGIPAPKGTEGVTISKMNLLDVLIGRLNQTRKSVPAFQAPSGSQTGRFDAKNLDKLIENYMNQIRQASAASRTTPYLPSPNTQPGALFSLIV